MTDYLYAQALGKMAAQLSQIPATTAKDSEAKPSEDFQKLLDRKSGETPKTAAKTDAKTDAKTETQPVEKAEAETQDQTAASPVEDPQELEKQMALAAMAVMQNPVVTEEAMQEIPDEMIVPVEEASAEVMSIHLDAPQSSVQETSQPVLEENSTDEAEELVDTVDQPIEAPKTEAKAPEQDKVEIRVTTTHTDAAQEEGGEEETPVDVPVEKPVFEDVHDIPVKVGEAPAEEPEPEVPVEDQIGSRLAQALNAGDTHVEIQLNPENLGKVTVEMTFAENGSLHVTMHAESGKTLNLLEKGLDNLHLMLAKNTQQEVHVEVQKQEETQQQNFYDGRGGHAQDQERQRRHEHHEERRTDDFLQQLRLGLVPEEIQ